MFISNQSYSTPTNAANTSAANQSQAPTTRQDTAGKVADSDQNKAADDKVFLSEAFEQMLANRIGLDKEKMDELKDKIEQLEKLENPTEQQKKQLEMLTTQLEEMVREAAERAAEKLDNSGYAEQNNKLLAYQQIESLSKAKNWHI